MEKIYTEDELRALGFYFIEDGGETYYQKLDNEEDYINSPFQYSEKVGEDSFIIKRG